MDALVLDVACPECKATTHALICPDFAVVTLEVKPQLHKDWLRCPFCNCMLVRLTYLNKKE